MSEVRCVELTCEACNKQQSYRNFNSEWLPEGWEKVSLYFNQVRGRKIADYIICGECRARVHRTGFFALLWEKIKEQSK